MICDSPVNIRDPVNPESKKYIAVPCGRCSACLMNKRMEWTIRIKEELRHCIGSSFVTLTYNDQNLPIDEHGNAQLSKSDLQNFFKRLRKNGIGKFRYYAVGEYGSKNGRPHYHIIFLGCGLDLLSFRKNVEKAWSKNGESFGRVDVGTASGASSSYTAGYIINRYDYSDSPLVAPFALASKGLGSSYIDRMKEWHSDDLTRQYVPGEGGVKLPLPRYYKNKLYDEKQKRKIKKLNEERIEKQYLEFDPDKEYALILAEMDIKEARKRRVTIRNKKSKF